MNGSIHDQIRYLRNCLNQFITVDMFIEFDGGYSVTARKTSDGKLEILPCNKKTENAMCVPEHTDSEVTAIDEGVL